MKSFAFALTAAMLTATASAAPAMNPRSAGDPNVADIDLPPTAYWVIAGHKKREVQIDTRQLEGRELTAEKAKELGNSIILVSVVHAVKADDGVNAYSDYVEDADPKEILGE
ncbi:hypothetical protein MGU_00904 [Metarhizium guizhouense ARSEF 977]|uniref:Uncharacterized protein n=1 Tax=Metarhizium guizhouense (strain ARSEF 977) TaxID=1276136 RepID=A0A0B4H9D3_METGA|nr:hypothetical protein MGU_00904 [Metarhizium guizhouense ARSEF 977]